MVTPTELRQFERLAEFTDEQLILLLPLIRTHRHLNPGELVIPLGYDEACEFFLLQGDLQLIAEDGKKKVVMGGSPEARHSIARLRPSMFEVRTLSACVMLALPSSELMKLAQPKKRHPVPELSLSLEAKKYYKTLAQQLENQTFQLKSLPRVALKLQPALEQPIHDPVALDALVRRDPNIAAKLMGTANRDRRDAMSPCQTTLEAIKTLGLETATTLARHFAQKQVFVARHPWVKLRSIESWLQAQKVAQIAQMLASRHPHLSRALVYQLGQLHNLGEMAVLQLMDKEVNLPMARLEKLLHEVTPAASALLLSHLHFDAHSIEVLAGLHNWQETSSDPLITLTELVRVARLHHLMGSDQRHLAPRPDSVPAFAKLTQLGLTPEFSLAVINESNHKIARLQQALGISLEA